jgi:uncharacterized protein YgiM (DUF1202 family)
MEWHTNFPKDMMRPNCSENSINVQRRNGRRRAANGAQTIFLLVSLVGLASVCFAQQAPSIPAESSPPSDANALGTQAFPCLVEITGDDVNVRSGPGTNYYACGRLYLGDKVKAISSQLGWSRVAPPPGCFSWISMQCVSISLENPAVGMVTGNGVRVYAGSEYVEPMHSTSEQVRLNRGDKVKLLGEEKDDYYKIAPPDGAYVWVSSQYTRVVAPVEQTPPVTEPVTEGSPDVVPGTGTPPEVSAEAKKLEEFYALKTQVEAERDKPLAQQNYADVKEALKQIATSKEAGKAVRYAEFMLKQIERYELVLVVVKELQLQDEQLQQTKDQIGKARTKRLAEVENLGRFAAIGEFQDSRVYDAEPQVKRYRVVDKSGKIICYAVASGAAMQKDLSEFIGQKVGLVGTIEPHAPTAGALVTFTEIVQIAP